MHKICMNCFTALVMSPYTQSSGVAGAFHRIHTHILLDKKKIIFSILWISIQIGLFVYAFFLYSKSADYASARKSVGALSLTFARSSAFLISFNSALIVFSMCRMTITYLWNQRWFKWIPFEHSILLHKLIGYSIVMFTLAHIGAHYFNYLNLSITIGMMGESRMSNWIWDKPEEWAIMSGPGWTGQIALFSLFLIVASSFEVIRRKNFEIFWYLHHLFIVYMVVLCFHGAFCFIKIDRPSAPCKGPSFFQWVVPSIFWYLIERLYREVRARRETRISKIILHPSKVLEIQFYKPSLKYLSGQYIFLQCPDISRWQWHPFTVTSAPEETILSVHIRLEGDWTEMIGRKCGLNFGSNGSVSSIQTPSRLPIIRIDGPYGAASQDVFKYEIVICIGAGIGQTPFSSILKHIWYRVKCNKMKSTLKKVYFIGVCRDTHVIIPLIVVL